MNERERMLGSLLFGKPDRVSFAPGAPRESTLERWRSEGLSGEGGWLECLARETGIELPPEHNRGFGPGVNFNPLPEFEEKVLEHRNGHYLVQSFRGEVVEISDKFDFTYLRSARDFVTRKWHKFPVGNEKDWELMRRRYDPASEGRLPEDFDRRCAAAAGRDNISRMTIPGPFWQIRDWCGFENLCMMMAENPGFVDEMARFWKTFVLEMLDRVFAGMEVDYVCISEDMAYKQKSMISPAMTEKFLLPVWDAWVAKIKGTGRDVVIDLDSDGYIEELIPLWIEAGMNCCSPIEIAAGNDLLSYRKRFGPKMAYRGGVDKRLIARGGRALEEEMERIIPPMLEGGGYVPSCDHGVPPDVSWGNFVHYSRLLAGFTGWL